jgi:hypothetical protein
MQLGGLVEQQAKGLTLDQQASEAAER